MTDPAQTIARSLRPLLALAACCLLALPLGAQERSRVPAGLERAEAAPDATRVQPDVVRSFGDKATFTIQYDDGEADNGYGPGPSATFYDNVMRFDLPEAGLTVEGFEVCLSRLGDDNVIDFDITFWRADGPGGEPGALIDAIAATATGVSAELAGTYYLFDLSGLDVVLPAATAYVGVGWDPTVEEDFFVCSDYDRATVQPAYSQLNQDGVWNTPPANDPDYTAMMYRLTVSDDGGTGTGECTPSATTLCLNDDRFRVEVDWRTPAGATGQGQAVMLTDDTGYFWFFNPANVEMVLKVLNGCPINDRFWVFAGGLTNVEVDIVVTDTETGGVSRYTNPLGTPFQPIQDTRAFATCP